MLMVLALLAGCSVHTSRTGLIDASDQYVELVESTGRTCQLVTSAGSEELHYLSGCVVEVSGRRLGNRLLVQDWHVTDAGDGSQPYVGRLLSEGGRLLLDERSTPTPVVLLGAELAGLGEHLGRPVLVVGFVVGAQEVQVVSWRVLEGDVADLQR